MVRWLRVIVPASRHMLQLTHSLTHSLTRSGYLASHRILIHACLCSMVMAVALVKLTYQELQLSSMDNKQISKATLSRAQYDEDDPDHPGQQKILIKTVSKKRGVFICPGSKLMIGQKDVEIGIQVSEEDVVSGMFFMKHAADSARLIDAFAASAAAAASVKKPYVTCCIHQSRALALVADFECRIAGKCGWRPLGDHERASFRCHSKVPSALLSSVEPSLCIVPITRVLWCCIRLQEAFLDRTKHIELVIQDSVLTWPRLCE